MRLCDEEFAELVQQAVARLPEEFAVHLHDVAIDIAPAPDADTLRRYDVPCADELLGLYVGVPLTERSVEHGPRPPDRILIFKDNIERMCRTRAEVVEEVYRTVFHEIGHHFGLDEDDLFEVGFA